MCFCFEDYERVLVVTTVYGSNTYANTVLIETTRGEKTSQETILPPPVFSHLASSSLYYAFYGLGYVSPGVLVTIFSARGVAEYYLRDPGKRGPLENVRTPKDIEFDIRSNHTSCSSASNRALCRPSPKNAEIWI